MKDTKQIIDEFLPKLIAACAMERIKRIVAQNDKWITIKGNHILLKDGESIDDAFKRVTGVSFTKANKYEKKDTHKPSKEYEQILKSVRESNNKELTPE